MTVPIAPAAPGLRIVPRSAAVPPTGVEPVILVAGARAAAVHQAVTSLLRTDQRLPHLPRETCLVIRGQARALDDQAGRGVSACAPARPGLAARRIDAVSSDPLLDRLTVVAARAVTALRSWTGPAGGGQLGLADALILVTDGRFPYDESELRLMHAARAGGCAIVLASTHVDEAPSWPDVARANQTHLALSFPDLAFASWVPVGPGADLGDLRAQLSVWATEHHRGAAARRALPVLRVRPSAEWSGWREALLSQTEISCHRATAVVRDGLDHLVNAVGGRPVGTGRPVGEWFADGLQELSLDLAAAQQAGAEAVIAEVLGRVLDGGAKGPDSDRVRPALRRDISERYYQLPTCYRAVRLTGTAVAAVSSSGHPLGGLAAHRSDADGVDDLTGRWPGRSQVLPPVGIALTTNCRYVLARTEPRPPWLAGWVARAADAARDALTREIDNQFRQLAEVLTDLITEGLDHGLLLV